MSFFKNRDQEILEELKKFDEHLEKFEQRVHDDLRMHVKPIASLLSDLRMTFDTVKDCVKDLNNQFQNLAINHLADRIQNDVRFQAKVLGQTKNYEEGKPLCRFSTAGFKIGTKKADPKVPTEWGKNGFLDANPKPQAPKKNNYSRYTKAQKAKIFSMLDAGQKPTPIAKKLNIPVSYVYYMQKENRKKKDTNATGKTS